MLLLHFCYFFLFFFIILTIINTIKFVYKYLIHLDKNVEIIDWDCVNEYAEERKMWRFQGWEGGDLVLNL